jgi:putative sterol carrier protein
MSYPFLSDEWIQAARDIRHKYADSVPPIEILIRINVVTTKVPFGDGSGADLTITTEYEIARSVFVDQDPTASMQAFMSGRIKVEGDITRLMAMQTALPQTDEAIQVAAEIKAITA